MNIIVILGTLVLFGLLIYAGIREGAFFSAYVLLRNLFGFLLAMALMEPLANFVMLLAPKEHPWPQYYRASAFAMVFAVVFVTARWLKMHFTPAQVPTFTVVDKIAGGICGTLNSIVVVGILLILWSLMPFAKFIPGDFGRIKTDSVVLFPGKAMLHFYKFMTYGMPGGRKFLLEDEPVRRDADGNESFEDVNNNGVWDRGWLWLYRSHADIHIKDIKLVTSPVESERPTTEK